MRLLLFISLLLISFSVHAENLYTGGYTASTNTGGWVNTTLATIDISAHTDMTIDVDWGEIGTQENQDVFKIQYRIDGGGWVNLVDHKNDLAGGSSSASITGLNGVIDLVIRTRLKNDDAAETWWHDNLIVTGTPVPLPVELLYFKAKSFDSSIIFDWATASEINNDYFTIQESKDGLEYNDIHYIAGVGNSSSKITYSITDHIGNHNSYYRLKQVDFDGTISYSRLVKLTRENISKTIVGVFDINGRPVNIYTKGIIIIKYSDGTINKVLNPY